MSGYQKIENNLLIEGNISITGTVDSRDIATDGTNQDNHISANSSVHGISGNIVGTSDSQTLTNKTINADNNTISNITNAEIKASAAINTNKIADGSVSNTEFQYLDGVSSGIQSQLDGKSAISHTHITGDITSGTFANARISESSVTQHVGAIIHDSLSGFVANEHIDHSNVAVNAGEGLSGGGTITTSRTIDLDIAGLSADATPDGATDYVVTYDASASGHKKVLLNNLPGGGGGSGGELAKIGDFYDNTGNQTFTGPVIINIDTVRKNTGEFSLNNDEITVNDTDTYLIIYRVSTEISDGTNRTTSLTCLERDTGSGFVTVDGSCGHMYNREIVDGQNTCTVQIVLDINSGDKFRIRADRNSGTSTVSTIADGSGISFISVSNSGPVGATGPAGPAGTSSIFGTEYQYVESNSESTTTSSTLQTKTTLTTSSLPSGTYRLGYAFELSNASNGVLSEAEVKLDGSVVALSTFEADDDYHSLGGFIHQSLSGVVTATIKHRIQTSGTSKIRRARLELWRSS